MAVRGISLLQKPDITVDTRAFKERRLDGRYDQLRHNVIRLPNYARIVPDLESNNLEVHPLIGDGRVLLEEVKTFLANWMSATRVCGSAVVQRVRKKIISFPACFR
jgi:hypothetical protein